MLDARPKRRGGQSGERLSRLVEGRVTRSLKETVNDGIGKAQGFFEALRRDLR